MRPLVRRFARSDRGVAAIEFCLVAPLLLLLMGGIVEFGSALQANNQANRLATQYAIAYADCSDFPVGTCRTELASYASNFAVSNIAPALQQPNFTLQMFQVTMNGAAPSVTYASPSGAALTAAQITAARGAIASGQSGVVVSVTYTHRVQLLSAIVTPFLGSSLSFPYTVAQLKS